MAALPETLGANQRAGVGGCAVRTALNTNYGLDGATLLRPTAILNARFVQFSVTVNY